MTLLIPSVAIGASVRSSSGIRSSSVRVSSPRTNQVRNNSVKTVKPVNTKSVTPKTNNSAKEIKNNVSSDYSFNPFNSNFLLWALIIGRNNSNATSTSK